MQLAFGAIERVLAWIELAGGNLDRHAVDSGAVNARETGIDSGSRATGLSNDNVAFHVASLQVL